MALSHDLQKNLIKKIKMLTQISRIIVCLGISERHSAMPLTALENCCNMLMIQSVPCSIILLGSTAILFAVISK